MFRRQLLGVRSVDKPVEVVVEAQEGVDISLPTLCDECRIGKTQMLVGVPLEDFDGLIEAGRRDVEQFEGGGKLTDSPETFSQSLGSIG